MPGTLWTLFLLLPPDHRHNYGYICPDRDRFVLDFMALPVDVLCNSSDDPGYVLGGPQTGNADHR